MDALQEAGHRRADLLTGIRRTTARATGGDGSLVRDVEPDLVAVDPYAIRADERHLVRLALDDDRPQSPGDDLRQLGSHSAIADEEPTLRGHLDRELVVAGADRVPHRSMSSRAERDHGGAAVAIGRGRDRSRAIPASAAATAAPSVMSGGAGCAQSVARYRPGSAARAIQRSGTGATSARRPRSSRGRPAWPARSRPSDRAPRRRASPEAGRTRSAPSAVPRGRSPSGSRDRSARARSRPGRRGARSRRTDPPP